MHMTEYHDKQRMTFLTINKTEMVKYLTAYMYITHLDFFHC